MDLDAHVSPLLVWLDGGFASTDPIAFLHARGIIAEVIGTVDRKGVQVEPRCWKIEQIFGCLQRYRRLRVDGEVSLETSRHMTVLAAMFMTGMRLKRMPHS